MSCRALATAHRTQEYLLPTAGRSKEMQLDSIAVTSGAGWAPTGHAVALNRYSFRKITRRKASLVMFASGRRFLWLSMMVLFNDSCGC